MSARPVTTVLVGSESLLIQCGQRLLTAGVTVRLVVSDDPGIARWAAGAGLECRPDSEAPPGLGPGAVDYLLSIGNLRVLSDQWLALARVLAVNFHDGPLPLYRGRHTTSWALIHRESRYGVTWHVASAAVDRGAIVEQELFDVAADETALTLNAKCYEAGVRSFERLLAAMVRGAIEPRPATMPEGRHYRRRQRPAAAGHVDWRQPLAASDALIRALDFGPYANPLCLPWSCRHGRPQRVDRRTVEQAQRGHPVEFDPLDADLARRITERHEAWCDDERDWVSQLSTLQPFALAGRVDDAGHREVVTLAVAATPGGAVRTAAAIVVWLARTFDQPVVDVGWCGPGLAARLSGLEPWFEPQPPVRVALDFDQSLAECVVRAEAALRSHDDRGSFLRDLVFRYPELRGSAPEDLAAALAVAIVVSDQPVAFSAGTALGFRVSTDGRVCDLHGAAARLGAPLATWRRRHAAFIGCLSSAPARAAWSTPVVDDSEREVLVHDWAATAAGAASSPHTVDQFEAQAALTPDVDAVIAGPGRLTYRELNRRATRLGRALGSRGVGPGTTVGLHVSRTIDLLPCVLGVLKAGAAYLPLDPAYPEERLRFMVADSGAALVISDADLRQRFGAATPAVTLDDLNGELASLPDDGIAIDRRPADAIYVIYTSGSTAGPKGVVLEHGNVTSFFAAMDERLGRGPAGTWLAVTSLSFDISVLELLWTVCRGFTVVLHADASGSTPGQVATATPIDFSLFYFASDDGGTGAERYRLLLDGARFADQHGFEAVWTPERHFHAFGGLYPNPAITSAAIASVTRRVAIRAGSLVMPLHHPVRVAEDWSLVDNLSNGRAGVAFASGWHPDDFVFAPQHHATAKQVTFEGLDTVRRLWRGEAVTIKGPQDRDVVVRTLPRPVQAELPFWITTAGNPETFRQAGAVGGHVLTHLLGQTLDEVAAKIQTYRAARREAGHDGPGRVTLMLHTFVGDSDDEVREIVRGPMKRYLASSLNLVRHHAWSFPAFKGRRVAPDSRTDDLFQDLSRSDFDALLDHAFTRYFETGGLFGSPTTCAATVDWLRAIGVDELACLIDFGVPADQVLAALPALADLRRQVAGAPDADQTIAGAIERHGVTHLQCTPSLAAMLAGDARSTAALGRLTHLLVGGEALPGALADRLLATGARRVTNMYGPTETTIWSVTHDLHAAERPVPIGRPIAGTSAYVLDRRGEVVPTGLDGELYLGGPGVARGYHDRPDLTRERFVPDRFAGRPGARLYRTGDRVRYRPDGVLEYVGRIDHQVKVRGHRIELGEIESELRRVAGVADAAVVLREDSPGDQRLVAYVTVAGATPARDTWQTALRQRLPGVMVPSAVVVLDALPLTPNGKIDRRKLAAGAAVERPGSVASSAPPQDEMQRQLAALWQEVLHAESVGVDDNFFDLGGHSLLTLQIAQRLGVILGRALPITDLFRFPTIRTLAEHLSAAAAPPGAGGVQAGQERAAARYAARLRRQER